ncbi:MAG: hypothetical protein ACK5MT_20030 [Actinomycetales bacterium]
MNIKPGRRRSLGLAHGRGWVAGLRTCLVAAALVATVPGTATAMSLPPGQELSADTGLDSDNGQHLLYVGDIRGSQGLAILGASCDAMTLVNVADSTTVTSTRLVMQLDGNLVLYASGNGADRAVWSTGTVGTGHHAVMQDDRNLVVYDAAGTAVWASGTVCDAQWNYSTLLGEPGPRALEPGHFMQSADRRFRLIQQTDGNLVLYSPTGPVWSTGTYGHADLSLVLEDDGALHVLGLDARPMWDARTGTAYGDGYRLVLQNDGNLVLYRATNYGRNFVPVWSSGTAGAR